MRARLARPLAGAALLVALTVSGCSSGPAGTGTSPSAGTTPSGTGSVAAAPTRSGPTGSVDPAVSTAVSTVKGRSHDVGTVVGVKTQGGLTVLVLDRWTMKGMSDAQLAAKGAPVTPHTKRRYVDQNSTKTYLVPVSPLAPIVVNTCDKTSGSPLAMTSTPTDLKDWLASPGRSKVVVLLTYDASGHLTRLDTDPAC